MNGLMNDRMHECKINQNCKIHR